MQPLNKRHGFTGTIKNWLFLFQSLVTGNIPGFVDVVLNFGSTVLTEDNLIGQLKRDKWRLNFFGDDTWIKLFPSHFDTEDGTTSFFVADYTEVFFSTTSRVQI